jgi:hypothetical protein
VRREPRPCEISDQCRTNSVVAGAASFAWLAEAVAASVVSAERVAQSDGCVLYSGGSVLGVSEGSSGALE